MARTDLITQKRYNDLQTRIAAVLGTAATGYGSAVTSTQLVDKPVIQAIDMMNLRGDMVRARQHQTGSVVSANDLPIIAKNMVIEDSTYTTYYEPFMTAIETYKLDMADNQSTTQPAVSPGGLSTRSTAWNKQVKHTVRFDFGTELKAKYFFNAGGEVLISANLASPVGAKSTSWNAFLAGLKTIKLKHGTTTSTGNGTGSSIGYSQLTSSLQPVFTANDTGTYAANSYTVSASKTGQFVDVTMLFNDAVAETPLDALVTGTLTSRVSYRIASGNNVSLTPPAVSTTYDLNLMPGYMVTLTTTSGTPGVAFEGTTVTASVEVYSGPSKVWYLIGGNVTSADLTAPVDGNGDIAMAAEITLVNGNKSFNIDIKSDGVLDTNTMQLFIYDDDPTLPTANELSSSNVITIIDSVSLTLSSVSTEINETTNKRATINIASTGIPNGTPIIWEVTGETGQDVTNRLDIVSPNTSATTGTTNITDSTAYFQIAAKANNTTDGDIRLKIRARWESNGSTVIQSTAFYLWLRDTSGTPVPSVALYQNPNWLTTGVNEGTGISIDVTTQNIPNNATINWTITNASGTIGITAADFNPATLSGIVRTIVPSGSTTGTCNIPLTIAADSSFNEGSETFLLTATTTVNSQTYSGTCGVKINDTSTFPGLFVKGANYTDPVTKIVYTKLTLSMTTWPVGSVIGNKFNYTVKAYATTDTGFTNPLITFTPGEFINNTNSSYDAGIAQPHAAFNVVATITNANYNPPFTSTLAVAASTAPTVTVTYLPDGTANVDSNVTFNVSGGVANGYYYLEKKNGSTYTRSPMYQLDGSGNGTGTFTSNSVALVTTRINCVSGNPTADHDTNFVYSTETVSIIQQPPYYTGIQYTAQIRTAKIGDTYNITGLSKCKTNKLSGGPITNTASDNVFTVTPTGTDASYDMNLTVGFAQSGHQVPLTIPALTKGLTYSASTLYGDIKGKITTDITITLTNATFVVDLTSTSTHVVFPNAPTWLSPTITRVSDTQVKLTIVTRSPTTDNLASGFNNFNITFLDAAFTDGGASTLLNYKYNVNIKFPTVIKFTTDDTFVVPFGVSLIQFTAVGGMGGIGGRDTYFGYFGFTGTTVTGKIDTLPSSTITIKVGKNGGDGIGGSAKAGGVGGVGYSNGGGGGTSGGTGTSGSGGGGGGSSAILINDTLITVAGGGGGGGGGGNKSAGRSNTSTTPVSGSNGGQGANRGSGDGAAGGGGGGGYVGGGGGNLVSGDNGGYSGNAGSSYTSPTVTGSSIVSGVSNGAVDPKKVTQYFPGFVTISYQLP